MRLVLPLTLLALLGAGCSTPEQKASRQAAREAKQEQIANSRAVEERRLRAVDGREIASQRAAEIYVADPNKTFDPNRTAGFGSRGFQTGNAQVKDFRYADRVTSGAFRTRDFTGTRTASMSDAKYATSAARTKDYGGPNAAKPYDTPSSPTREAREAGRTVAVRDLPGGKREYLGPEATRAKRPLDPMKLPRVTEDLRELKTIEDIRALLNKNK